MREIVLKIAGAVILLIAAVGYGALNIKANRAHLRELEAILRFLRHIRTNIEHLSRPLPEIYAGFSDAVLEENGFLPALRRDGIRSAVGAVQWRLSDGELSVLTEFAEALGRGYREEQVSLCRYTEEVLGGALEELQTSAPAQERLYRTIPVLLALSGILVLL